ncbi:MAG: helix-turn-helix transcriptional regulator [Patescibacteria group bacterium]|nr:helix-turn-helix transcriptional regulator [Patescibacteria group bacterium]
MIEYKKIKNKILEDKEVKKEYEKLGVEFSLIEKIIEERIKKGLTQKELAKVIGTKQSAISRFESGSGNPTLSFIGKVSDVLDLKLILK